MSFLRKADDMRCKEEYERFTVLQQTMSSMWSGTAPLPTAAQPMQTVPIQPTTLTELT
ncbi:hypothetical protein SK128_026625, partial [Halocaridina rubra]